MIKILRNKDFNITDFLVDDINGINHLANTNTCAAGSTAYVVETGETFVKNTNGEWVYQPKPESGENVVADSINGDIYVDGDFLHINIRKFREASSFFNQAFKTPVTYYISDYLSGEIFEEITLEGEFDECGISLENYQDRPIQLRIKDSAESYGWTHDIMVYNEGNGWMVASTFITIDGGNG